VFSSEEISAGDVAPALISSYKNHNVERTVLKGGPTGQLPGSPLCKGH